MTGAKSKIKSLVDRDKHRFYYNNYDNLDNRDIKVEIYEAPDRRRFMD